MAAVVLLAVVAGALRLWRLGDWGFYFDELYTVEDSLHFSWDPNAPVASGATLPAVFTPVTYLLTRLAFGVWGVNEWSARLPSAVAGAVAVALFYVLFARMSCRRMGGLGALLIAVSPWHIYHSQEARFYALLFLFGGASAFAFYIGLERGSRAWMFASALLLLFALLTQTAAVFVGVAFVTYLVALYILPYEKPLGLRGRTLVWFFLPLLISGVILVPFALNVLQRWGMRAEDYGYTAVHIVQAVGYNFGVPLLAVAGFGLIESFRRRERLGLFGAVYAGVPLLLLLLATVVLKAGMGPRYLLAALPGFFLLSAYGGVQILRYLSPRSVWLATGVVALMLTAQLPLLMSYYVDGDRADYRRAAAFLAAHAAPQDVIMTPQSPYTLKYYLRRPVELLTVSEETLRRFEQSPG
ncbi:MAG: glycosyltransferase family 39 protein, partial [Abditibacteriales bacterium]|nr:glycosyltransferase family 39 protein [Abditibacteriales bacterium]MDW8364392.1 glycosyltransferase family 39 protein [Abditibacteriales bacterium]